MGWVWISVLLMRVFGPAAAVFRLTGWGQDRALSVVQAMEVVLAGAATAFGVVAVAGEAIWTALVPHSWQPVDAQMILYIVGMCVSVVLLGLGTYLHGIHTHLAGIAWLWIGAILLAAGGILDLFPATSLSGFMTWENDNNNYLGFGFYFLWPALLAVTAALVALWVRAHPSMSERG